MVANRFALHSAHISLDNLHHLKQTSSITDYIEKFEQMMALMQMDYPNLTEAYFVSSFIAGSKEGIKHYLIPHIPQNLCDTYWKARELEKGILVKKSLMRFRATYTKAQTT
jgi:tryptophan synthase alpha subunit